MIYQFVYQVRPKNSPLGEFREKKILIHSRGVKQAIQAALCSLARQGLEVGSLVNFQELKSCNVIQRLPSTNLPSIEKQS